MLKLPIANCANSCEYRMGDLTNDVLTGISSFNRDHCRRWTTPTGASNPRCFDSARLAPTMSRDELVRETRMYEHPLVKRYATREMSYIWSPEKKFSTWRRLWIALAKAEQELGIPITDEQIAQMEEHIMDIDFDRAEEKEAETRHDVMAHVYTYGESAPAAQGIIHMGATS